MTIAVSAMNDDAIYITARHEAAHAVMKWVLGWPATELTAGAGEGLCAGSGRKVDVEEFLLVTLAGLVYECWYQLDDLDLTTSDTGDLRVAREIVADHEWLRPISSHHPDGTFTSLNVDEAVAHHLRRVSDLLDPYMDLIEAIGYRLEWAGRLSARTVAAICREYAKRQSITMEPNPE